MTNEEAIKWFENNPFMYKGHKPFETAIEALKQTQWIPCESITEPIDREVLCCDKYDNELIGWLDYNDYYECWVCESDECVMYDTVAYMEKPKPYEGRTG